MGKEEKGERRRSSTDSFILRYASFQQTPLFDPPAQAACQTSNLLPLCPSLTISK